MTLTICLHFIVSGVAAWRIASLLVRERGPYAVFERLRNQLSNWEINRDGDTFEKVPANEWAHVFSCVWCLSVWVTVPVFVISFVSPYAVAMLAAMTTAIIVEHNLGD